MNGVQRNIRLDEDRFLIVKQMILFVIKIVTNGHKAVGLASDTIVERLNKD